MPVEPDSNIVAEVRALSNGQTITVYRSPFQREGPVRIPETGQPAVLRYMFAHFVFTWRQGATSVDIGHGTLRSWLPLWGKQPIDDEWSPDALVSFGHRWTRRHLARFETKEEGNQA